MNKIKEFINKLVTFFNKAKLEVDTEFVAIFGKSATEDFAKASDKLLHSMLGKIVVAVVTALNTSQFNGTPEAKKAEALKQIIITAKVQGISVSTSIANMLIELVVNLLNKNFPTV